jgi:hypothetical protein
MTSNHFWRWRLVHRTSSVMVALIALIHCGLTFMIYGEWSPDAVWFLGTGIGLFGIAVMNIAHVGLEPCYQPTAPPLRWLNWLFVGLGLAALYAVREPQAFVIVAALVGQAIASLATLSGSAKNLVSPG